MPPNEHPDDAVYLPSNEPYLGRLSVLRFDRTIQKCLADNQAVATYTHTKNLNRLQLAACQIIPQGINLALSLRELVRQGYLFAAVVLLRPLVERAGIITYLVKRPDAVKTWENGWKHGERPGLPTLLQEMEATADREEAKKVAKLYHHMTHGDPIGSAYNLVSLGERGLGYAVSKNLNDPDLCDFVCDQATCYLVVLAGRMAACFPGAQVGAEGPSSVDDPRIGEDAGG